MESEQSLAWGELHRRDVQSPLWRVLIGGDLPMETVNNESGLYALDLIEKEVSTNIVTL